MGRLRVTNGPLTGQTIEVGEGIVIGREDVDLVIDDEEISRRHVAVRRLAGALEVEDLGSSNGTFIDGERIDSPRRVGGGAQIRLGATILAVEGVLPVERTRLREVPGAQTGAVADPQLTRARDIPVDLGQATRASEVPADLAQATRASEVPADLGQATRAKSEVPADLAQATRASEVPVDVGQATTASDAPADLGQPTRAREVPADLGQPTRASDVPADLTGAPAVERAADTRALERQQPAAAAGAPVTATSASAAVSTAAPLGAFSPPQPRRKRGLASRSWVPTVLSFGTVILVAVALVIYFATR